MWLSGIHRSAFIVQHFPMYLDTPARIAILGAGSIGLEAALYARYLGYDVDLYERGQVAEHVRRWGHARMFTPFRLNRSPLALAALKAQDESHQPPGDEEFLTGREYADRYLVPLAQSDLLSDSIHSGVEVLAIGREGVLKTELVGDEARGETPFRLLLREANGQERIANADAVIDCTGTHGYHNWLGEGGIPAIGETAAAPHIEYGLPDVLDREREKYARRHTLVIGAGDSAAATVTALADLGRQVPDTWITWVTREEPSPVEPGSGPSGAVPTGPVRCDPTDPFLARQQTARAANRLTVGDADHVTYRPGTSVESVRWHDDLAQFVVRLIGKHAGELQVERIVANVGHRPNDRLYAELQVKQCYATGGSLRLATALSKLSSRGELASFQVDADMLLSPEPRFFVLGAKSFGRNSNFLLSIGLDQIRAVFSILGDRAELNLYATMAQAT